VGLHALSRCFCVRFVSARGNSTLPPRACIGAMLVAGRQKRQLIESAQVPVENRKLMTAPGRSPEQRLRALAKANEVRLARAQLKRELAAGKIELAQVLSDPPACARTARVRELLLAVPKIGPARVERVLARCRIASAKTVAGLSERQRAELVELLRRPS
jgi:hypothetical protein